MSKFEQKIPAIFALVVTLFAGSLFGQVELNEHLKTFEPYLNKTMKGELNPGDGGEVKYDISRFEAILNGQAIRAMHSVNDGDYGGETIIMWDKEKESLVFYYFTTAGFYTSGTLSVEENKYTAVEKVVGNENGITEVKSTSEIREDGTVKVESSYLKNGEWVKGHSVVYHESPESEIKFK